MSGSPLPPTSAIFPVELSAERLARVDEMAAASGMTREGFLIHVIGVGLEAVESGYPLPPIDLDDEEEPDPPGSGAQRARLR
jgi:hypothetical protein